MLTGKYGEKCVVRIAQQSLRPFFLLHRVTLEISSLPPATISYEVVYLATFLRGMRAQPEDVLLPPSRVPDAFSE